LTVRSFHAKDRYMNTCFRSFFAIPVVLALQLGLAGQAGAQDAGNYPARPIRLIVGFGAGGASDLTARLVGNKLKDRLGQSVVIENRPGAGGVAAADTVAKAAPDGHTLLLIAANNAISTSLFKSIPYDIVADFAPIGTMAYFTFAFVARTDARIKSIGELIAFARQNPKKLTIGTTAIGGGQYLTAELFKSMSGVDLLTVPFNTTPAAVTALRGGEIDFVVDNLPPVYGPVKSGSLVALAVTSKQRFSGLPSIPTLAESGVPGFEADTWNAIVAPAKTPGAIVARLNREINAVLQESDLKQRFVDLGAEAKGSSPEGLRDHLRAEIDKWRRVIEKAGIEKQ
jgi:tripartite-type tricarboxylate transporter receptor subunit TctC